MLSWKTADDMIEHLWDDHISGASGLKEIAVRMSGHRCVEIDWDITEEHVTKTIGALTAWGHSANNASECFLVSACMMIAAQFTTIRRLNDQVGHLKHVIAELTAEGP